MNRREFLAQSTMLAAIAAILPGRNVSAQKQTNLLEFSAVAAIAAMQKGDHR